VACHWECRAPEAICGDLVGEKERTNDKGKEDECGNRCSKVLKPATPSDAARLDDGHEHKHGDRDVDCVT